MPRGLPKAPSCTCERLFWRTLDRLCVFIYSFCKHYRKPLKDFRGCGEESEASSAGKQIAGARCSGESTHKRGEESAVRNQGGCLSRAQRPTHWLLQQEEPEGAEGHASHE